MNPKPGYQSTEFWATMISVVLSFLTMAGLINAGDSAMLGDALTKSLAGVAMFVVNAAVVVHYVKSRIELKSQVQPDVLPYERPGA